MSSWVVIVTDRQLLPVSDRRLKANASPVASDPLQAFAGILGVHGERE